MTPGFRRPPAGFFEADVLTLARALIGAKLVHDAAGTVRSGIVVETEAYSETEPASHAYRGRTDRNWPMFEDGGMVYVYLVYGLHHCFNISAGPRGRGEAVLVRALQPLEGLDLMSQARKGRPVGDLCRGPGNLCRAMGITTDHNGADLRSGPLRVLVPEHPVPASMIAASRRIGITSARELEWRFYLRGSPWVSASRS